MKTKRLVSKHYVVHSIFLTIQGEGCMSGHRAVFIRMSGCNVWNGMHTDRDKALAPCGKICDTEFFGCDPTLYGGKHTSQKIVQIVAKLWKFGHGGFVVITGGEPSLQVDEELVDALQAAGFIVAVETNGFKKLPKNVNHVTLSPKPPSPIVEQRYDEVKVLYPLFDPLPYAKMALTRWVQPVQTTNEEWAENTTKCVDFVLLNPGWCLSLQTHKYLGIP